MSIERIREMAQGIACAVEEWAYCSEVGEIERDMLLDRLRELYSAVKGADALRALREGGGALRETAVENFSQAPASADFAQGQGPAWRISPEPHAAPPHRRGIDRNVILSLYGGDDEHEQGGGDAHPTAMADGGTVPQVPVVPFLPVDAGQEVAEPDDARQEDAGQKVAEPTEPTEPTEHQSDTELEITQPSEPKGDAVQETPQPDAAAQTPPPLSSFPSHKVLGEVIGSSVRLGETLGGAAQGADVASMAASSRTVSLSLSLGVNDRFMVISSLFAGDAGRCDAVVEELDSFGDLDGALVHIYENYGWPPDNEGAKLLIELLTRKLS